MHFHQNPTQACAININPRMGRTASQTPCHCPMALLSLTSLHKKPTTETMMTNHLKVSKLLCGLVLVDLMHLFPTTSSLSRFSEMQQSHKKQGMALVPTRLGRFWHHSLFSDLWSQLDQTSTPLWWQSMGSTVYVNTNLSQRWDCHVKSSLTKWLKNVQDDFHHDIQKW